MGVIPFLTINKNLWFNSVGVLTVKVFSLGGAKVYYDSYRGGAPRVFGLVY